MSDIDGILQNNSIGEDALPAVSTPKSKTHIIDHIIQYARDNSCSDIHLTAELPPVYRRYGSIMVSELPYGPKEVEEAILSMLNKYQLERVTKRQDLDFCYILPNGLRQRVNIYYQQRHLCAVLRVLNDNIPSFESLDLPPVIRKMAENINGLVLVTGPTGSGKSTTLAAMIDYINRNRKGHILTLEDPIEYVHKHRSCIVHQRELGVDVDSFKDALRSALREDPDIILVGEMRDQETIEAAVTAAETGHLVLSTLHTTGAANTIDRIIDAFPDEAKGQIRTQLAAALRGVVTQQLLPLASGTGRCPAFEILVATDAVSSLIRENKCFQINSVLQTGTKEGMISINSHLAQLVRSGMITKEIAMERSNNIPELEKLI